MLEGRAVACNGVDRRCCLARVEFDNQPVVTDLPADRNFYAVVAALPDQHEAPNPPGELGREG